MSPFRVLFVAHFLAQVVLTVFFIQETIVRN